MSINQDLSPYKDIKTIDQIPTQKKVVQARDKIKHKDIPVVDEEELNKLLNVDIEFKIVQQNLEDLQSTSEVKASFEQDSRASKSIYDHVVRSLNNKTGVALTLSREEFTDIPTKIGSSAIKKFIEAKYSIERHNTLTSMQLFFERPMKDAKEIFEKIKSSYLPDLKNSLVLLTAQTTEMIKNDKLSDIVINKNNELLSIVDCPIKDIAIDTNLMSDTDKENINRAFYNLDILVEKRPRASLLILACLEKMNAEQLFDSKNFVRAMSMELTFRQVLDAISSQYLSELVKILETKIDEIDRKIDYVMNSSESSEMAFEKMSDFVREKSPDIIVISSEANLIYQYVIILSQLFALFEDILDSLVKK